MSNVGLDLNKIKDKTLIGFLSSNEGDVQVELMKLSADALKKIVNTIEIESVRRENQEFVIDSILINIKDRELFEKGQSSLIRIKNGYALTADSRRNPKCFMGIF